MSKCLTGNLMPVILMGIVFIVSLFACIPCATSEEVYIICNKNVPLDKLSRNDLKKIFLGLKTEWNSELRIKFAVLGRNNPLHKQFLKNYINKSISQFNMYWQQRLFLGIGFAPKSLKSEADLIEYVAKIKGAVGYASKVSNPAVKIIAVQ